MSNPVIKSSRSRKPNVWIKSTNACLLPLAIRPTTLRRRKARLCRQRCDETQHPRIQSLKMQTIYPTTHQRTLPITLQLAGHPADNNWFLILYCIHDFQLLVNFLMLIPDFFVCKRIQRSLAFKFIYNFIFIFFKSEFGFFLPILHTIF